MTQTFRLTPTEIRVALFVIAAFMLGLITKCYRDSHPVRTPIQTDSGTITSMSRSTSRKASQPQARTDGRATKRTRKSPEKLNLPDSQTEQEY